MQDKIMIEEVEFSEELYQKNMQENDFPEKITDGIGSDEQANN